MQHITLVRTANSKINLIVQSLMHRNAPSKALIFSMAASLLDVFGRNEPIRRQLRLPEELYESIRPLFWSY